MPTIYDRNFYADQSGLSAKSARITLSHIFKDWLPKSYLDVGCGIGTWLHEAKKIGVARVLGIDGSYVRDEDLLIEKSEFRSADLTQPLRFEEKFDFVSCLEVAEHLPHRDAKTLVDSLAASGDVILFGAALPYQGGDGHINENWLEYWSALFRESGFVGRDLIRPLIWHDVDVGWWYRQNTVVYENESSPTHLKLSVSDVPRSVVHPEFFLHAIRRSGGKPFRTTGQEDLEYWGKVQETQENEPPGYGPEFDSARVKSIEAKTYSDLKSTARWKLPAVLADAIAPMRVKNSVQTALTKSDHCPDFIGIGVQKAASTWLYRVLDSRPDTFVPPVKEVSFFNRRWMKPGAAYSGFGQIERASSLARSYFRNSRNMNPKWAHLLTHLMNFEADQRWYEAIFRDFSNMKIRFEITPEYAMLPVEAIEEILTLNPQMKFILMLRDPVQRVMSHLSMIIQDVPDAARFLEDLAHEESVLARSRYDEILPKWQKAIPASQFLILDFGRVESQPKRVIHQISDFLGIDPQGHAQELENERIFSSPRISLDESLERRLERLFLNARDAMNEALSNTE